MLICRNYHAGKPVPEVPRAGQCADVRRSCVVNKQEAATWSLENSFNITDP